jgi:UDP-N-acetylmuramyl-tripeptide synthetase
MMLVSSALDAARWFRACTHAGVGTSVSSGTLQTDSRRIRPGDAFMAWPGAASDGRQHVLAALQAGAAACLVEAQGVEVYGFEDPRVAKFEGLKAASGLIASAYFEEPSHALDVVAVTGTNGKTSTAWWLAQALNAMRKNTHAAPYSCGLIGTLGLGTPGQMVWSGLTTPDPVMLQAELARLRDAGATACAMEASSIGLAEHRMAGTQVRVAIFTNFTQDHLDYHGSMQSYWLAKRALFDMPGLQTAVINLDDPKGNELRAYCLQHGLSVISTSRLQTEATLFSGAVKYLADGMQFSVHEGANCAQVTCPVVGDFNRANMLGVLGALRALGVDLRAACSSLDACTTVPGRMELLSLPAQALAVVDYAHTPDALMKALAALRPLAQARGGKLWCVFGCGGNRDAHKRPLMAKAAEQGADQVVLTSDNPRDEAAQTIADHLMAGFTQAMTPFVELDRGRAIAHTVQQAAVQDVILIAGKGHETYQEIAGIKHPFSDREQALLAMRQHARGEHP